MGADAATPTIGQILLMNKNTLATRVLADPRIQIYSCGKQDIQAGAIDRRVLATLEFLVASGFNPTVSALECGHSYLTDSGNVSEHSSGNAVDIAAINGIPILDHQGAGSITEMVIRTALKREGLTGKVDILPLGGLGPALTALAQGAVAAAPFNDPALTITPDKYKVLFYGHQYYPKFTWQVAVTTREFAGKNSQALRKILDAVSYTHLTLPTICSV